MKAIYNYTYHNLMTIAHAIMKKGYDEDEAITIAEAFFRDSRGDINIYRKVNVMLTKEEYEAEYK